MKSVSATFAWPVKPGHSALAGDTTIDRAGSIGTGGYSLTLSTLTAGVRYLPRTGNPRVQLFGQMLAGAVHSSGTPVEGANPGAAFAANLGGGLGLIASRRFAIRLIEADYLVTTVDNSSSNHQNNLRMRAGVVVRF